MRCSSALSRVSWRRRRTPTPLFLGLRAFLYQPYQTRAQIAMGGCYVLCAQSGVTWTVLLRIARDASCCSSPQDIARRRSRRTRPLAYQLSGRPLPGPSLRARETRGITPSLFFFFKKNFAVAQVLKAGTLRKHTTFTRHYLRDLSHRSLDTFYLGPVVAVQALV